MSIPLGLILFGVAWFACGVFVGRLSEALYRKRVSANQFNRYVKDGIRQQQEAINQIIPASISKEGER